MIFKDRTEAGKLLAKALKKYKRKRVVVYAIPRGGVTVAVEIAKYIKAPLDLIISKKIGHPNNPEYAIAAITEKGHFVGDDQEIIIVNKNWFDHEIEQKKRKAIERRLLYLKTDKIISPKNKIAILVDDGVATGLSLRAAIMELKHLAPKKIIVAVPIAPESIAEVIKNNVDELVVLDAKSNCRFIGSVSSCYKNFPQVSDKEIMTIMENRYKFEKAITS